MNKQQTLKHCEDYYTHLEEEFSQTLDEAKSINNLILKLELAQTQEEVDQVKEEVLKLVREAMVRAIHNLEEKSKLTIEL